MKTRLVSLFLLLVVTVSVQAQSIDTFNTATFWHHVKREQTANPEEIAKAEISIIMVSNRISQFSDSLRFMGIQKSDTVHYFFVYKLGDDWHVLQTDGLQDALQYMQPGNRDWVVYTEGMGKIFTSDIYRGTQMAATYGVNVIMLDYPSILDRHGALKNYKFAIRNARIAYKDLVPVIDSVKILKEAGKLGTGHLTLFFHSMGNNVVRAMVRHGMLPMIDDKLWADNLVLNAACVKQRHHRRWLDQIKFVKAIYVNYNPNDKTLRLAHLAAFKKQLGEKVRKPISSHAYYINFSKVAGERHSNFAPLIGHAQVIDRIIGQYNILLHGGKLPLQDTTLYHPSDYRGIGWDMQP